MRGGGADTYRVQPVAARLDCGNPCGRRVTTMIYNITRAIIATPMAMARTLPAAAWERLPAHLRAMYQPRASTPKPALHEMTEAEAIMAMAESQARCVAKLRAAGLL